MGTETKSFGSSSREGHDSSSYYARKMNGVTKESTASLVNWSPTRDKIICKSSVSMRDDLLENSVALMITSPPYNVGKDYDADLSKEEYLSLLEQVFRETHFVLEPGGRACINIANLGRRPYIHLTGLIYDMMHDIGFMMRGEIIWKKANGANGSCAWGSYLSAKNPTIRDVHEYILIFSKGRFDRPHKGESDIERDAFLRDTRSIWEFGPESARRVGHPAPFPVELPERLINLYSYKNDLVLDPFMGSGTTCVAAKKRGRAYVGFDTNPDYCILAHERLKATMPPSPTVPMSTNPPTSTIG